MGTGWVKWIGVRPERRGPLSPLDEVLAVAGAGLAGDHYRSSGGKRQLTLIREEDLAAAAAELGRASVDPLLTRRNLVVQGLPPGLSNGTILQLGEILLEISGPCHPCSRMEENLGPGGLKALAGRGGLTARILHGGRIRIGDPMRLAAEGAPHTANLGPALDV
jgi:MOSC domain-containing protein YiiM